MKITEQQLQQFIEMAALEDPVMREVFREHLRYMGFEFESEKTILEQPEVNTLTNFLESLDSQAL